MSLKTQLIVFSSGFALCLAIVIPLMLKWNKPDNSIPVKDAYFQGQSRPDLQSPKSESHQNGFRRSESTKGGWLASLVPVYTVAILGYVLYMVFRIMQGYTSKQQRSATIKSRNLFDKKKRSTFDIDELEKKLLESEKSVEKILQKAHSVMKDVYCNELEESSLSDTTEEEGGARIQEIDTTSSANNDSHQDSSSTNSEQTKHHRKSHQRSKKLQNFYDLTGSSTSEDEQGSEDMPTQASTPLVSSSVSISLANDSNEDLDETDTEDDVVSTDGEDSPLIVCESNIHEIDTTNPPQCPIKVDKEHVDDDTKTLTDLKPLVENKGETKQLLTSEQVQKERDQLMQTTNEVMSAVRNLKGYIKEQEN